MSYVKREDVPSLPGEVVVQLDTDALIAVQCEVSRSTAGDAVVFRASARWVDAAGVTQCDPSLRPVALSFPTTVPPSEVDRLGVSVLTRECMMLLLGEPLTPDAEHPELTIVRWSSDIIAQCSLRNAIAAASVVAPSANEVL